MKVIGLTGSIAMGKSEIVKILRTMNIPVFSSDDFVHEIYANGIAARALEHIFPSAVEGKIVDRQKLSKLLIGAPDRVTHLEAIIHPLVHQAQQQFIMNARAENHQIVVLDIPLLFETNRHSEFDKIIVVSAHADIQRSRAMARPHMTQEKLDLILARQMPDHKKRQYADYIIENNGTIDDLQTATQHIIASIRNDTSCVK